MYAKFSLDSGPVCLPYVLLYTALNSTPPTSKVCIKADPLQHFLVHSQKKPQALAFGKVTCELLQKNPPEAVTGPFFNWRSSIVFWYVQVCLFSYRLPLLFGLKEPVYDDVYIPDPVSLSYKLEKSVFAQFLWILARYWPKFVYVWRNCLLWFSLDHPFEAWRIRMPTLITNTI